MRSPSMLSRCSTLTDHRKDLAAEAANYLLIESACDAPRSSLTVHRTGIAACGQKMRFATMPHKCW
jgi:hypothetical protein